MISVSAAATPKVLASPTKLASPPPESKLDQRDLFELSQQPSADWQTNFAKLNAPSFVQPQAVPPSFNEEPSNTDFDQSGIQKKLVGDLGADLVRMQFHQDVSHLNGKVPTQSELQKEFDKLAARKDIPFEYIKDGCYARAHLMCDEMNHDGMNNSKMFVMVEDSSDANSRLEADNKYMHASWWYHVAPVVFAQDDTTHQVAPYIMDPSMAKTPLKAQDWIHAMWDEQDKIKIDITRNPQYAPAESGEANQTFEESLPSAKKTAKMYSILLAGIKAQHGEGIFADVPLAA